MAQPFREDFHKSGAKNEAHKIPTDPIYGEDAVLRFALDHFHRLKPEKTSKSDTPASAANPKLGIFVNLSANRGLLNSSLRENDELLKLQSMTKDKPVTIVAQVAMNRDQTSNHLVPTLAERIINNMGLPQANLKDIEIARYEISNGRKRLLYAGPTKGQTADLADLLASDPQAMKADKIVLLNRAHGEAMHGILGDAGHTPVNELKSTLTNALVNTGHAKFDLLDLDSCLMGNAQVMTELAPNAKYVIASEEPEVAIAPTAEQKGKAPTSNAQPITEEVRRLIKNSSSDFDKAVHDVFTANGDVCAKSGSDGLCGANTLGLYDLDKAEQFSQALDHFGEVLSTAAPTSDNMTGLQSAINSTPAIEGESDKFDKVIKRADLGTFVSNIRSEMKLGRITDTADGAIERSAIELQSAMSSMVRENFNSYTPKAQKRFEDVHLPAAELSGVSVFLPPRQPNSLIRSYYSQLQDESIASQPHWNKFVNDMAEPFDKVDHASRD